MRRVKRGFSLIELMVVISIMGILVAIGAVSYTTMQKKSRDARRKEDVKAVQVGFEQYYVANNAYAAAATMFGDTTIFPGGQPTDPKPSPQPAYHVGVDAVSQTYCVCASLEVESGNHGNPSDGTPATCNYGSGDWYCVSNQQ